MEFGIEVITSPDQRTIREEMERIGVSPEGIDIMAPKAQFFIVKISGISGAAASILKQEMLAKGGEAAVSREAARLGETPGEVLLMGHTVHYRRLLEKLKQQPFGLAKLEPLLQEALARYTSTPQPSMIKGHDFIWDSRTYVMGIINVTPDSFSGEGVAHGEPGAWVTAARQRAEMFLHEGADLLDIGGESTRPGAKPVALEEEMARVLPVVENLAQTSVLPISVDTQKAKVAAAALAAGADIINDIWGLQKDPDMPKVVADYGATVIVMHNKENCEYRDLMGEILAFLEKSLEIADRHGIPRTKVWVDPGIGFGKTTEQNLEVLRRLDELKVLGCPILLGTSRKSVIGNTLNLPVEERLEGTAATVSLGIAKGTDVVRVHDVKAMVRTARMTDAIVRRS